MKKINQQNSLGVTNIDTFKDEKDKYFDDIIVNFTQSESKLEKFGKVEIIDKLNRVKCWINH